MATFIPSLLRDPSNSKHRPSGAGSQPGPLSPSKDPVSTSNPPSNTVSQNVPVILALTLCTGSLLIAVHINPRSLNWEQTAGSAATDPLCVQLQEEDLLASGWYSPSGQLLTHLYCKLSTQAALSKIDLVAVCAFAYTTGRLLLWYFFLSLFTRAIQVCDPIDLFAAPSSFSTSTTGDHLLDGPCPCPALGLTCLHPPWP